MQFIEMALKLSGICNFLSQMRDIILADIVYAFPYAIKWLYRSSIKKQIKLFPLEKTINRKKYKAHLFLHGSLDSHISDETSVILLLHGVYGHPFSLLHLADIAQGSGLGPVFSIYLSYNELSPE